MHATATGAIDAAFKTEIMAQLGAIEDASRRAVEAANGAADRLMRQLITIMDTSASVEQRAREADQAIAASDRDSLAKQAGLLTEASFPEWTRCDGWIAAGTEVSPYYDPLLSKVMVHGKDRADATALLAKALERAEFSLRARQQAVADRSLETARLAGTAAGEAFVQIEAARAALNEMLNPPKAGR